MKHIHTHYTRLGIVAFVAVAWMAPSYTMEEEREADFRLGSFLISTARQQARIAEVYQEEPNRIAEATAHFARALNDAATALASENKERIDTIKAGITSYFTTWMDQHSWTGLRNNQPQAAAFKSNLDKVIAVFAKHGVDIAELIANSTQGMVSDPKRRKADLMHDFGGSYEKGITDLIKEAREIAETPLNHKHFGTAKAKFAILLRDFKELLGFADADIISSVEQAIAIALNSFEKLQHLNASQEKLFNQMLADIMVIVLERKAELEQEMKSAQ